MTESFLILLADDYVLFRREAKKILRNIGDVEVIGEASDGAELLELLKNTSPHMAILDITIPDLGGLEAINEIKKIKPGIKVLILTLRKDKEYLDQAIKAGADGYMLKEDIDNELLTAIETLRKGKNYISPRLYNN